MKINKATGLLSAAKYIASPNCDLRPAEAIIDLLVLHGISLPPGEFGGPWIDALFTNTLNPTEHPYFQVIHQLRVSTHLLIRRDGDVIQYVPFHLRAWHAGQSCFQGRERCNDYSIGIELEGADDTAYSDQQYTTLSQIILVLLSAYPAINRQRIVAHSDIAPGRKTDPGPAFNWPRLWALLDQA